jgi:hypothetical protein
VESSLFVGIGTQVLVVKSNLDGIVMSGLEPMSSIPGEVANH